VLSEALRKLDVLREAVDGLDEALGTGGVREPQGGCSQGRSQSRESRFACIASTMFARTRILRGSDG